MSTQQLNGILAMSAQNPFPINAGPQAIRAWVEIAASHLPPADKVSIERVNCGRCDGDLLQPSGGDRSRLIIFYHGGCFFFGSARTHRVLASHLARAAGCAVLIPDYRLAPEHPGPAAHEDALGVYQWALRQGYAANRIALSGDSAGGNLAVSTALRAKTAGLPRPAALALMSPWVDFVGEGASHREVTDDPIISEEILELGLKAYINGIDLRSALVTPLYSDLTGLPPTLVHVGSWERLGDDSVTLVQRLSAAGVDAQLKIFAGMCHTWQMYAPILEDGMASLEECAAFIKAHQV